jgi:hypothetical protein
MKKIMAVLILSSLTMAGLLAQTPAAEGERQGPPPHAFKLCEGKPQGAPCQAKDRQGNPAEGNCFKPQGVDRPFCRPNK